MQAAPAAFSPLHNLFASLPTLDQQNEAELR
jgi:hypothetical protein